MAQPATPMYPRKEPPSIPPKLVPAADLISAYKNSMS